MYIYIVTTVHVPMMNYHPTEAALVSCGSPSLVTPTFTHITLTHTHFLLLLRFGWVVSPTPTHLHTPLIQGGVVPVWDAITKTPVK